MNFQSLSKPRNQLTLSFIITGTFVSVMLVLSMISQVKQSETTPVIQTKTTTPSITPSIQKVTALGRLEPTTEVIKLSVPSMLNNDQVAKLLVKRGDSVKAGQIVAIMSSRLRLQTVLWEAQAQVKVARAELAKVKAGAKSGKIAAQKAEIVRFQEERQSEIDTQKAIVDRWQAEVRIAKADYDRYLSLYQQGAIASEELDRKKLALETAQAQLDEAKAKQSQSLDTLSEQIKQARATLDDIVEVRPVDIQVAQAEIEKAIAAVKAAKAQLDQTYIYAPITGQILDIYARPGEVVGENGIAELGQTTQMQVVAEIYQTDISKVRTGQQALITSDLFPEKLRATVKLIGLQVIKQEVTSGKPGENLDRKVIQVRMQMHPDDSRRVANLTNLQVQVAILTNSSI
ncbi:MAG: ABC exporter membrane fusion protein [Calothrix sp. MO_192.B10]|nr:ABC exporter membrane fusion protein [Calothrix sp. MO_192.B10]